MTLRKGQGLLLIIIAELLFQFFLAFFYQGAGDEQQPAEAHGLGIGADGGRGFGGADDFFHRASPLMGVGNL